MRSQGGDILDAVATLGAQDGLPLPPVKAKKGSVWAPFFASGRLTAADYYRRVVTLHVAAGSTPIDA